MSHRTTNWLIATLISLVMSSAYLLDGPDDRHAEHASAMALEDALKLEARQERFAKAAAAVCGPQAHAADLGDGTVQCHTKRGRKTSKVAL